ncbi:hypothetical protein ABT256_31990 [Amycolatopsis japonica]|uniref:hypothetical protein n=1 Tax=Amycolatopsis japonica TaxID=208439 RepID=UPI0033328BD4
MATTSVSLKTTSADLVYASVRVGSREGRRADLIAELQTTRLAPAVVVPGIEHLAAAAIVQAGLPSVEHQRCTLHRSIDEHLFLDVPARTGVRILACWDDRSHRIRMHCAEVGASGLWDRIVVHFTWCEMSGRPVPVLDRPIGLAS